MKRTSLVSQSVIDASDALLARVDAKIAEDPVLQSQCQQVMEDAVASIRRMAKGKRNMERIRLAVNLGTPIPKLEEL